MCVGGGGGRVRAFSCTRARVCVVFARPCVCVARAVPCARDVTRRRPRARSAVLWRCPPARPTTKRDDGDDGRTRSLGRARAHTAPRPRPTSARPSARPPTRSPVRQTDSTRPLTAAAAAATLMIYYLFIYFFFSLFLLHVRLQFNYVRTTNATRCLYKNFNNFYLFISRSYTILYNISKQQ